jgi:hypothetical protein
MTRGELIELLKKQGKLDTHVACNVWSADDVKKLAEELGLSITKEDANNIIDLVEDNIDCSEGISWNTLGFYIKSYLSALE